MKDYQHTQAIETNKHSVTQQQTDNSLKTKHRTRKHYRILDEFFTYLFVQLTDFV